MVAVPMVRMPRAIRMTSQFTNPESNVVNLASSVGAVDQNPDYYYDLLNRVQTDITARRQAGRVDVSSLMKGITPLSQWKPNVQLPPSQIRPGSGSAPQGVKLSGGVDQWIAQAYKILGIRLTPTALAHEKYLIQHESSGNPRAQNNWDSNARKGTPSKGIAQVIDPTFQRYKMPGYNNIWDPVSNLLASLRYRKGRYGTYDIGNYGGGY